MPACIQISRTIVKLRYKRQLSLTSVPQFESRLYVWAGPMETSSTLTVRVGHFGIQYLASLHGDISNYGPSQKLCCHQKKTSGDTSLSSLALLPFYTSLDQDHITNERATFLGKSEMARWKSLILRPFVSSHITSACVEHFTSQAEPQ